MRSIPDSQAIAMIAIMSLLTFFVRGLPFLLFSGKSKTPAYIMYLGKVLPYAIIGMLVVYCSSRMFPCCRHRSDSQS